jgi:hypothetical protein
MPRSFDGRTRAHATTHATVAVSRRPVDDARLQHGLSRFERERRVEEFLELVVAHQRL